MAGSIASRRLVRDILRLGLAQAFWLDTPDFAAVDTAVRLAPAKFGGLVNAILRGALREGPPPEDTAALAPAWLFARWRTSFGAEPAEAIAGEIAREPATDLTLRVEADPTLAEALGAEALGEGTLRTTRGGDPSAWPGFAEGTWWVQDFAAAIPARLLAVRAGQSALDVCAAPGGKGASLQLAAAGAKVTSLDRSAARLRRLEESLVRTALASEVIAADALVWKDPRRFDAVLLDAPCSATGTFRRHPDVLWNVRPADIVSLAAAQSSLLTALAARVTPGGRLVYSVCSLEAEEGESQIRAFLGRNPDFVLEPAAPGEGGAPAASVAAEGWLRILPHHRAGGLDGFFIARLRRRDG